ncbi:MAG TPA: MarR family transcriptional regulator [Agrobacterium sp.]|uniref:MarR family winged helix-turn-helix transcriptional regulator n=1 Tax=Agrobacterium pusense TaxID=648995 RepID=UPI000DB33B11|nr:MarR family transcriptional regulator [Agrobacterium pusense]MDH0873289.1 MarR family transcriptional regulator [Agrobacterium pusense]MDH1269556.1 MarR family transcriptional regulator [Agrobacterium pusense]PZP55453.1 MAG: MarR family transcriptional regulator [Delftia acidovorans]HAU75404.1 MarR family transcriptional regulator [Agrobacterium sp.]
MMNAPSDTETSLTDVSGMLCFSLYSAGHAFTQLYRPLLDKIGLTYPQYLVMVTLWRRDGQPVRELGKTLFLDSSTLTPLLKRLEAAGLITRTRNRSDEREVLIHLTEKGGALRAHAADIMRCIAEAVGMDAEALGAIKQSVDTIRDKIKR